MIQHTMNQVPIGALLIYKLVENALKQFSFLANKAKLFCLIFNPKLILLTKIKILKISQRALNSANAKRRKVVPFNELFATMCMDS